MVSSNKLGFALIGCSGVGEQHAFGISSNPKAKLIGVCDIIPEKADKLAKEYNSTPYYNYRELISKKEVDIVDIVTPDETHAEIAVESAKLGKHVLVEKPMAISLEEAKEMIDTSEKNGIKMMCAQSCRFLLRSQKILETVNSGKIGLPIFARLLLGSAGHNWTPDSPYVQKYKDMPYFLLLHNGMHSFDFISALFGEFPKDVYVTGYKSKKEIPLYEYFVVNLGFSNNRMAISEENRIMNFSGFFPAPYWEIYVVGTTGTLSYNNITSGMYAYTKDGSFCFPLTQTLTTKEENPFYREIDEFINAIIENREPMIPIRFSGNVLCAVLTAVESFKSGLCEKVNYVF